MTCNMAGCEQEAVWHVDFGVTTVNVDLYLCDEHAKKIKGRKELAEHEQDAATQATANLSDAD